MGFLKRMGALFGSPAGVAGDDHLALVVQPLSAAFVKTGEQLGAMSDPQGKRIYHEYSVGEARADGTFPWSARVYTNRGVHAEANEVADTAALARAHALNWALTTRKSIEEQP